MILRAAIRSFIIPRMAGNPAAGCSRFHRIVRIFLQSSKGTVRYSSQIFHGPSTYGRSKLTGSLKAFRVQSITFCQGCLRSTPDIPSFIYNHLFFVLSIYPSNVGTRNAIFRLMHRSEHAPCLFSAGFSAMIF